MKVDESTKLGEYFIPDNGAALDAIRSDILRYLGNDAIFRTGNYEDPITGNIQQGYIVTSRIEPTMSMIEYRSRNELPPIISLRDKIAGHESISTTQSLQDQVLPSLPRKPFDPEYMPSSTPQQFSFPTNNPTQHPLSNISLAPQDLGGYNLHATNDRPFKCDQCPQQFSRNHDLKRHKCIHLPVRPFSCNYCEKSFSRKDALKRHMLVRGGDKDHQDNMNNTSIGKQSPAEKQGVMSNYLNESLLVVAGPSDESPSLANHSGMSTTQDRGDPPGILTAPSVVQNTETETPRKSNPIATGANASSSASHDPTKKPIKFKDAVGRKFSFPFHLCATWAVSTSKPFDIFI